MPYGGLHSYTGTTQIDLRFPGQLMQAESGLYYNWNRQYDPTTGRYTQTDPLGLVDGSSRYAYVGNDPLQRIDPTGLQIFTFGHGARHAIAAGFDPVAIEGMILQCIPSGPNVTYSGEFRGRINGWEFRGFGRPGNIVNIGTYYPIR
jgi:RHS repeat-associated protein